MLRVIGFKGVCHLRGSEGVVGLDIDFLSILPLRLEHSNTAF